MTKVVILAGGKGTRLSELTGETPKPLLMVGGKPLLQHIIDNFVRGGFTEFIIPVGYLGDKVFEYFSSKYNVIDTLTSSVRREGMWLEKGGVSIDVTYTGEDTLTGGRLGRLRNYLTEPFMMTYGDAVTKLNPKFVKEMGEEMNKNIVTAVHPIPRFGSMTLTPELEVVNFSEKVVAPHEWINGGYMYLKPTVLDHIKGDDCNFEKDVMPKLVWESGLYAFPYENYWHCVDTVRDLTQVREDFEKGLF
jgi:glucose-1-phosphate cytidylyltransferase